jgi:hypothetical protein
MKALSFLVVYLTICFVVLKTKCHQTNEIAKAKDLLHKTLASLQKNLEFLNQQKKHVNLDAIIGTRMVDGKKIVHFFIIYFKYLFSFDYKLIVRHKHI